MKQVYLDELVSVWQRHTLIVPDDFDKKAMAEELDKCSSSIDQSSYYKSSDILYDTIDNYDVDYDHVFEYSEDFSKFDIIY